MTQIKYSIPGVTKTPKTIKQSVRNEMKVYQLQVDVADAEADGQAGTARDQSLAPIKVINLVIEFFVDVMNLNDDQKEALYEKSREELMEHMEYISMRIMGMSDADIKAAENAETEGLENE